MFVESSINGITYRRGEFVKNRSVNLNLCTSIQKGKFAWYPDNVGKPAIIFVGCGIEWAYDDKEDRDRDYNKLIDIKL